MSASGYQITMTDFLATQDSTHKYTPCPPQSSSHSPFPSPPLTVWNHRHSQGPTPHLWLHSTVVHLTPLHRSGCSHSFGSERWAHQIVPLSTVQCNCPFTVNYMQQCSRLHNNLCFPHQCQYITYTYIHMYAHDWRSRVAWRVSLISCGAVKHILMAAHALGRWCQGQS